MKKRVLIITMMLAMCLLFTACGQPKVVGVKSLAAANIAAQSKVKSYHMDASADMDINLDSDTLQSLLQSMNPRLPVKMTLAADSGTDTAHITTEAAISVLGQSVGLQTAEVYLDMENQAAYAKAGDSTEWTTADYQDHQMSLKEMTGGLAAIGKTVLENATFEEGEDSYSLTLPAEKAGDLIADMHLLDSVDLGIADVREITVESGQIIYTVDKESLLVRSIELKDVDVRGKGVYQDASVALKFPINAVFSFSRYNELEEAEYAIPEEVKAAGK